MPYYLNPSTVARDAASQRLAKHKRPFYFLHISGFPYIWFTQVPSNWTPASGMTFKPGLMVLPSAYSGNNSQVTIEQELPEFGGICETTPLTVGITDDADRTVCSLLWATRKNNYDTEGILTSNNLVAGATCNLTVDHHLSDAVPSFGPVYMGLETISYEYLYGAGTAPTNFMICTRGIWHHLNTTTLEPVTFSSTVEYETANAAFEAPHVSMYPTQHRARGITLYRNYFDPDSTEPIALNKSETVVRFRGNITAIQQSEDRLGFVIEAEDITGLLDSNVYTKFGSVPLKGYSLPWLPSGGWSYFEETGKVFLVLTEELFSVSDTVAYQANASHQPHNKIAISIATHLYDTPSDLVQAIDTALKDKWAAGETYAPWYCSLLQGGYVQLGYTPVIYKWPSCVMIGKTTVGSLADLALGVKGQVLLNCLGNALGLGDLDQTFAPVLNKDNAQYRSDFRWWCGPGAGASPQYIGNYEPNNYTDVAIQGSYSPCQITATDPVSLAWFHLQLSGSIPCDLGEAGSNDFVEPGVSQTLPDGSLFYVAIPGRALVQATGLEYVSQEISLKSGAWDCQHPIANKIVTEEIVSVPYGTPDAEIPKVVQAWIPLAEETVSALGRSIRRKGFPVMLLQLLLSTGNARYNYPYFDILPYGWGLGIPADYVDIDSFLSLIDTFGPEAMDRTYVFIEPTKMSDIMNAEGRTLGFTVVTRNGKITAIPDRLPMDADVDHTIDDSVRVAGGAPNFQTCPEGLVNSIRLSCDYDYLDGEYMTANNYDDKRSQEETKQVISIEIENKGIRSTTTGNASQALDEVLQLLSDRLLLLSRETDTYTCSVVGTVDDLVVGDCVYVTDSQVANRYTGDIGITGLLGKVRRVSWNDNDGVGEICIQLLYHGDSDWGYSSIFSGQTRWNSGAMAPAFRVVSWYGNTVRLAPMVQSTEAARVAVDTSIPAFIRERRLLTAEKKEAYEVANAEKQSNGDYVVTVNGTGGSNPQYETVVVAEIAGSDGSYGEYVGVTIASPEAKVTLPGLKTGDVPFVKKGPRLL